MNTHTHIKGNVFLPSAIIAPPHRNRNRRRPPSPLGVWILIAITSILASVITYILTK
jgi:hypothetical protein